MAKSKLALATQARKLTPKQVSVRRAEGGSIAPNIHSIVRKAIHDHPEINALDEVERGKILDIVANEANGPGKSAPWGRKSRQRPGDDFMPRNPNTDGLTFLRGTDPATSDFEIFDVISGIDGSATWDFAGVFKPGENGFWARALGSPEVQVPTHTYRGGGNDTGACDECGKSRFDRVHVTPESLVRHGYDGGEQDTGLCDVCQKARPDTIHSGVIPVDPVEPDDPIVESRLKTLEGRQMVQDRTLSEVGRLIATLDDRLRVVESGGSGGGLDAEAVAKLLVDGLRVDVDVKPAGPKLKFLGQTVNLEHDHSVEVMVSFKGMVIARKSLPQLLPNRTHTIRKSK